MNNNTLKLPDNVEISALLHSEILDTSQQNEESLSLSRFMDSLQLIYPVDYSFDLRYCFQLMNFNFGEFPIVTVCIADVQYEGLGRSKNVRESPAGCLVFSFTIQMEDGQVVPLLQYVVSLAVTGAVQDPCDQNLEAFSAPQHTDQRSSVSVLLQMFLLLLFANGIGLNVDNDKKETCSDAVLRELSGIGISLFQRLTLFIPFGCLQLMSVTASRVIIQEKNENQVVERMWSPFRFPSTFHQRQKSCLNGCVAEDVLCNCISYFHGRDFSSRPMITHHWRFLVCQCSLKLRRRYDL
uniref:BPL/LPL catalytic domain-containing protein n=1 Tax=Salix viminalis TaxID=40686 RepID=A0A6N2LV39_SALVM